MKPFLSITQFILLGIACLTAVAGAVLAGSPRASAFLSFLCGLIYGVMLVDLFGAWCAWHRLNPPKD